MSVGAIKQGWIEYMQQPVLPASLAYVLLCFNVVLAPGGLMTAFLTQRGMSKFLFSFCSPKTSLVYEGMLIFGATMSLNPHLVLSF